MKVIINQTEIDKMMLPSGQIGMAAARAAGRVRDRAKQNAPVDQGLLRNSIISTLEKQGRSSITWRVGSPVFYALYQELGTGPIFARRAPLLVFQVGGKWVSTYSTRGVPASRYLTRAVEAVSVQDFL
jgi:HK97 gp10 family phage protein